MKLETRKGMWWVPGREDRRVSGTLAQVDDDLTLDLAGVLLPPGGEAGVFETIDRIVGIDEHGRHCALLSCVMRQMTMSMPGPGSMSLRVTTVIDGSDDSVHRVEAYTSASVEIDGLAGMYSPAEVAVEILGSPHAAKGVKVEAVLRATVVASVGDTVISLIPGFTLKGGSDLAETVALTHRVLAQFDLTEPEAVDAIIRRHVKPMLNLVRLAVDRAVQVTAMRVRADDSDWADVYYVPSSGRRDSQRPAREALFAFDVNTFGAMMPKWFDASERFSSVFDLFFATAYGYPMYAESRFLNLTQAIEAYDRIANPTEVAVREAYASRRAAVCANLDEDDQTWFLSVARDPSTFEEPFRKRIDRCVRRFQSQLGLSRRRRESAVQKVLVTRNFLTHWDERGASGVAIGRDLFDLTNLLRTILRALLVEEAGIDAATLPHMFWSR